jgi:hypothetical protein
MVIAGLGPAIHESTRRSLASWMPGSSPGMAKWSSNNMSPFRGACAPGLCSFLWPLAQGEGDGAPSGAPFLLCGAPCEEAPAPRGARSGDFCPRDRTSGDQTERSSRPLAPGFRPARPVPVQPSKAGGLSVPPDGDPRPPGIALARRDRGRRSRPRIEHAARRAPRGSRRAHCKGA